MIDWLRRTPKTPEPAERMRRMLDLDGRDLPLAIRRLRTARRMTLRLAPDGSEARITLPPWGRVGEAIAFASDRRGWLAAQLAALPASHQIEPGGALPYRGERLTIDWRYDAPRKPALDDGAVVLGGPRAVLESRLKRWLEAEAVRLFTSDAADYAAAVGLATPQVRLTRARRRWGSCATDGTIRLNWRLVMAPDHVRRSVVAHEIAHLVHFDHSPEFHACLARIFEGDLRAANRWLKREGRSLYAVFP